MDKAELFTVNIKNFRTYNRPRWDNEFSLVHNVNTNSKTTTISQN